MRRSPLRTSSASLTELVDACARAIVRRGETYHGLTRYTLALPAAARSALPTKDATASSFNAVSVATLRKAARVCSATCAGVSCAGGGSASTSSLMAAASAFNDWRRALRAAKSSYACLLGATSIVRRSTGDSAGSVRLVGSSVIVPPVWRLAKPMRSTSVRWKFWGCAGSAGSVTSMSTNTPVSTLLPSGKLVMSSV